MSSRCCELTPPCVLGARLCPGSTQAATLCLVTGLLRLLPVAQAFLIYDNHDSFGHCRQASCRLFFHWDYLMCPREYTGTTGVGERDHGGEAPCSTCCVRGTSVNMTCHC